MTPEQQVRQEQAAVTEDVAADDPFDRVTGVGNGEQYDAVDTVMYFADGSVMAYGDGAVYRPADEDTAAAQAAEQLYGESGVFDVVNGVEPAEGAYVAVDVNPGDGFSYGQQLARREHVSTDIPTMTVQAYGESGKEQLGLPSEPSRIGLVERWMDDVAPVHWPSTR